MKKKILAVLLAILLTVSAVPVSAEDEASVSYGTPGVDYVEGEVIVCVNGGVAALKGRARSVSYEMENLMDIKTEPQENSKARSVAPQAETQSLVLVKGGDTKALIKELEENPAVEYAEPNYIMVPYGVENTAPTDPYYQGNYQWGLENRLNENKKEADIPSYDANIEEAWNVAEPKVPVSNESISNEPVVVVLDSGVDYNHPDLKNRMWDQGENIPELKAMGGGKHGYNACYEEDSNNPMDTDIGHGTHCAGIIGAEWNNEGGAGVSSNSVKIMAIRFLSAMVGKSNMVGSIKGYAYIQKAIEKGVNVVAINNSWGPIDYSGEHLRSLSTAVSAVGEMGAISLFAAGNSSSNNDANTGGIVSSPYSVTVGALESEGHPANFSCYGQRTVDVFAPGTQILSSTTTGSILETILMPNQYLPQMMEADDSWYYENFESGDSSVDLKLLDQDGRVVEEEDQVITPGYISTKGRGISLDKIQEGDGFSIEMTMKSDALKAIKTDGPVYFAFQGGFDHTMYAEKLAFEYKDKDESFKKLESTETLEVGLKPARLKVADYRWNQSTQELNEPDFLEDNKGEVTLRLKGVKTETETGTMFRMDDIGFGKKAVPYCYADGTSMATPMVTGIAILLSTTANEDGERLYNTDEVIARLKGGVNREKAEENGLSDKSVSQGTIDAAAAFDDKSVVPVLNNLTVVGDTATIEGYFFGDAGTVTVGDTEATVKEWTKNKITLTIPADIKGLQEVKVTTSDKRYGRNYFKFTPDTVGYTPLAVPELGYGENLGYPLTSANAMPLMIAAAGNKIIYEGMIVDNGEYFMESYDIDKGTWSKFETSKEMDLSAIGSMTGGASKIYMSYKDKQDNIFLGIYDTVNETFTKTTTALNGTESLVVYKEQLLAIGGRDLSSAATGVLKTVNVIDPNTGEMIGSLPELPMKRSGAQVFAIGDTLILYGGIGDKIYSDTMTFDGTSWTVNKAEFLPSIDTDPTQTLNSTIAPVNEGLIAVGPVKNLAQDTMVDTWIFDKTLDTWSENSNVIYSQTKTSNQIGITHQNKFYVLSHVGLGTEALIFRSLEVAYQGPAKDAKGKEELIPVPTPKIETADPANKTDVSKNTKTGIVEDALPAGLLLVILLAATAGFGYIVKKKMV